MTDPPARRLPAWDDYLWSFHRERAGITERLLGRARRNGVDPYGWLVDVVEDGPLVLDVGSGSGPVASRVASWIGVDRSTEELAVARRVGLVPLLRATAEALPVRDESVPVVVAAMSLQVLEPIDAVMAELARVVRPNGQLVLLLPSGGPLPRRDALLYLGLQWRLRQRIRYPNDRHLVGSRLARLAEVHGYVVEQDVAAAFALRLRDRADAKELVASLYLPGVTERRVERAVALLRRRIGAEVAIPLRRVVLRRAAAG